MTEEGQPLYIPRSVQGFAEDPGLDEQSVADMTAEETKEYLRLFLRVLQPHLPSLTWLRAAASRPRGREPGLLRRLLVDGEPPLAP